MCQVRALSISRYGVALRAVLISCVLVSSACHSASSTVVRSSPQVALAGLIDEAFRDRPAGAVVLVAHEGTPIFRRAYGLADVELQVPMRPEHLLGTGSITKQFTAVAILRLVEEGHLRLTDDVRQYVPGIDTQGRSISVEQVLTHTSGLPNFADLPDFEKRLSQPHSVSEILALTNGVPLHFEPGNGFYYSDTGYILLGAVIERVSGLSYRDYLEQKLFAPLGMNSTFYGDHRIIKNRASGYSQQNGQLAQAALVDMSVPSAAGAIFSTVDDLLRWQSALLEGDVISAELLASAWSARKLPDGRVSGYGFGWKVCQLGGQRSIEHGGFLPGFLANALYLPDSELLIVVMVNNDADNPDPGMVARRIARQWITGRAELPTYPLSARQRANLVGRFEINKNDVRLISEQNGKLYSRRNDGKVYELKALSENQLGLAEGDGALALNVEFDQQGKATAISSSLRCEPGQRAVRVD